MSPDQVIVSLAAVGIDETPEHDKVRVLPGWLLIAEGHHGIDAHGAAGGDVAGRESDHH
jgi:hypothetical protein